MPKPAPKEPNERSSAEALLRRSQMRQPTGEALGKSPHTAQALKGRNPCLLRPRAPRFSIQRPKGANQASPRATPRVNKQHSISPEGATQPAPLNSKRPAK